MPPERRPVCAPRARHLFRRTSRPLAPLLAPAPAVSRQCPHQEALPDPLREREEERKRDRDRDTQKRENDTHTYSTQKLPLIF